MFPKKYRLMEAAGDDGAAGGGAADSKADAQSSTQNGDSNAASVSATAADSKSGEDKSQTGSSGGMTEKERELLREAMSRKEKIKELEAKLSEASNSLKVWEGLNPSDVKKLVQERRDAELKDLEKKGEFEKIRAQMLEAHEAEKSTLRTQIEELNQRLTGSQTTIDQLTVGQAFSTSRYISDELVLTPTKARTVYGAHFQRDESGAVIGYDKPVGAQGRTPLVDGSGNPLSFDEALKKIVEVDPDRDALLKAKLQTGANSGTTGNRKTADDSSTSLIGAARIAGALKAGSLKKFVRQ